MHYVDTLLLPLLFSVFLVALVWLGWQELRIERRRRQEGAARPKGDDAKEEQAPPGGGVRAAGGECFRRAGGRRRGDGVGGAGQAARPPARGGRRAGLVDPPRAAPAPAPRCTGGAMAQGQRRPTPRRGGGDRSAGG